MTKTLFNSMHYQDYIKQNPEIVDHIRDLMDQGLTKSAIARHIGISRDRLRTIMAKSGLDDEYERPPVATPEQVTEAIALYTSGFEWELVEDKLQISRHSLRRAIVNAGHVLKDITKQHRLHRWDGKVFGSWTVVPGTTGINGHDTVMTECVCGKQVISLKSNLLSRASKSCGCIGFKMNTVGDNSSHHLWTCLETGEVVETSFQLAKKLGIKNAKLYRIAARGEDYEDDLGYTWRASLSIRKMPHRRDLIAELDFIRDELAAGKSLAAIGTELDVALPTIYKFAKDHNLSGSKKGSSILEDADVVQIRKLKLQGFSPITISLQMNVRPGVIYDVLSGKTYTHV